MLDEKITLVQTARMPLIKITGLFGRLAVLALMAALAACSRPAPAPETTGVLQVGVRNSPTTYFLSHNGEPGGFEHDLLLAFAQSQNWSIE
ncbi:MAG: murein transglycosylase, partial [Thiobacillus sp.]|nr:murein transglycosylase [Thiobacillus sp.]